MTPSHKQSSPTKKAAPKKAAPTHKKVAPGETAFFDYFFDFFEPAASCAARCLFHAIQS
jgi:hypothetical protein